MKSSKTPTDAYDLLEPRDTFSKYDQEFINKILEMKNWSDKKLALESIINDASYPRLSDKNSAAVIELSTKLINDNNLNVMIQSLKLVGLLSKGLRKNFEIHAKQIFPVFLMKLKEKKTHIVQEVYIGLDNLLFSISLDQVLIELEEALEDKATALKINLSIWLQKTYECASDDSVQRAARDVATMAKKNTDDSTASIRNESIKLISIIIRRFPDQAGMVIRDFPPAKMKKLEEFNEGNTSPEVEEKKSKEPEKVEKKPEKRPEKKPEEKKIEEKKAEKKTVKKSSEPEDVNALISAEDAEADLSASISQSTFAKLKETSWKDKQAGLQDLLDWSRANMSSLDSQVDALFRLVKSTVKDWKENNVAVCKTAFDIVQEVTLSISISKKAAFVVLCPAALEKLADPKLTEPYTSCLLTICTVTGPKFVADSIISSTSDCTKPKLFSECSLVLSKIIIDFGVHRISLKETIDYCKIGLLQANPVMKKASMSLSACIFSFIGDSILPLLRDIKDATMKSLQEEFAKVEPAQKSGFKLVRGEEEIKLDPKKLMDNALPRANISASISANLLKKLTDTNWKVRKEGLDDIETILEANGKRVLVAGLEEMFKAVKTKLEDANKSIVRSTLALVVKLVESMGSEIVVYTKYIVPGLLASLADKQALMRQDALVAIDKWSEEAGADSVVNNAGPPLVQDSTELRTELINWLLSHKEAFVKCDLKQLAPGVLQCLQDRTAAIRNLAETLFGEVIQLIGFSCFSPLLKDIKPAVLNSLAPVFEKYKCTEEPEEVKSEPKAAPAKSKPITKKPTMKVQADHEVKTTRNKTQALDIRIIIVPGDKDRRLDVDSRYKWSVEEIRPDYLDKLKEQIKSCVSPDLYGLMFHADFKKQAEAATHLLSISSADEPELTDYIDILLKWSWIELIISSNTTIYKAVLELDLHLVTRLESLNYIVSDTEASLILPVLCDKSGQNNVAFRQLIRNIIHSFCKIYSAEKVFAAVLNGVNSKNARSKVECIEEIGSLVKDFGANVFQAKDIKVISNQINSSDTNVRAASVNAIGEVYKLLGDKTWTLVGDLTDKAKGILDQRFKIKPQEVKEEVKRPIQHKKSMDSRRNEPVKNEGKHTSSKVDMIRGNEEKMFSSTLKPFDFKSEHEKNKPSGENKGKVKNEGNVDMDKVAEKLFTIEKEIFRYNEGENEEKRKRVASPEVRKSSSADRFSAYREQLSPSHEAIEGSEKFNLFLKRKELHAAKAQEKAENHEELIEVEPKKDKQKLKKPSKELFIEEIELEDPGKTRQQELLDLINQIDSSDISHQTSALERLNTEYLEDPSPSLKSIASHLCFTITLKTRKIFTSKRTSFDFALFYFQTIAKICATEPLIKPLTEFELFHLSEELLKTLTLKQLDKSNESAEAEQILKALNTSLVKLLEIAQINSMFNSLLRLLILYKPSGNSKILSILIKCLLRLAKNIASSVDMLDLPRILLSMHEYLIEDTDSSDELAQKALKTIVNELVKALGDRILNFYSEVSDHTTPDIHINEWISIFLKALIASSASPPPVIIKPDPTTEMIAKLAASESYNQGVNDLCTYLEINTNVEVSVLLASFPGAFREKIMSDVNEIRNKRIAQSGSLNSKDMLSRMAMIKQKFGKGAPAEIS